MNGTLCSVNSKIVFMHIPNWQLLALELKSVSINVFVIFCAPYNMKKKISRSLRISRHGASESVHDKYFLLNSANVSR